MTPKFYLLTATNIVCLLLVEMDGRSVILRYERDIYGNVKPKASWNSRPGKYYSYIPYEILAQATALADEAIKAGKYNSTSVAFQKTPPKLKKPNKPTKTQLALAL